MAKLFVYGTLGPGQPNEHYMTKIGGQWTKAKIKGKLFEAGWGADIGYPGVIPDENGDDVSGHLFSSDNLDAAWPELDEFEGEEYERIEVQVELEDATFETAFVYAIRS